MISPSVAPQSPPSVVLYQWLTTEEVLWLAWLRDEAVKYEAKYRKDREI